MGLPMQHPKHYGEQYPLPSNHPENRSKLRYLNRKEPLPTRLSKNELPELRETNKVQLRQVLEIALTCYVFYPKMHWIQNGSLGKLGMDMIEQLL